MDRPDWVPTPAWGRLEAVLREQPAHGCDVLCDLTTAGETWEPPARRRLLDRFLIHATSGVPLPAALILALSDLLEVDD